MENRLYVCMYVCNALAHATARTSIIPYWLGPFRTVLVYTSQPKYNYEVVLYTTM